jgi:hypothetical protein
VRVSLPQITGGAVVDLHRRAPNLTIGQVAAFPKLSRVCLSSVEETAVYGEVRSDDVGRVVGQ